MSRKWSGATGEYINLGAARTLRNLAAFSVLGWFKCPDNSGETGNIPLYIDTADFPQEQFLTIESSGVVRWFYRTDTSSVFSAIQSAGTYDDDAWHWVFIVKRAANDYQMYIDGVSIGTNTTNCVNPVAGTAMHLGAYSDGNSAPWPPNGHMARWVGFKRAITIAEARSVAYGTHPYSAEFYVELFGTASPEPDYANNRTYTVAGAGLVGGNIHPPIKPRFLNYEPFPVVRGPVTLSRIDRTRAIYQPTVTRGAVTITQTARLDRTRAIYSPTLTGPASQTITQTARLDRSRVINQPTITRGAVTITLTRVDRTRALYQPTLTRGAVTLTLTRLDRTRSLYALTVTRGAVTITLPGGLNHSRYILAPIVGPVPVEFKQDRAGFKGMERGWEVDDA